MPPGPPASRPPRTDLEGLSEKYWGEILERTVSSNSLHALQRVYGQPPHLQQQQLMHKGSAIEMNGSTAGFMAGCGVGGGGVSGDSGSGCGGAGSGDNFEQNVHLSNFSNSEPRLCEQFHDANCAKNKAFFNGSRHAIKGLPDI